MKTKLFLSAAFALLLLPALAQTSVAKKTLTWHASGGRDLQGGKPFSDSWNIVTRGGSSIDLNRGTTQTLTYTIASVKGTWANEQQDGQLSYSISYQNNLAGTFVLSRVNGVMKATIDFSSSNPDAMHLEFNITHVE